MTDHEKDKLLQAKERELADAQQQLVSRLINSVYTKSKGQLTLPCNH